MPATRTQIYLTVEQRKLLDARGRREGKGLAQQIREAVDEYLESERPKDVEQALRSTFGVAPDLDVPSRSEWERGYG